MKEKLNLKTLGLIFVGILVLMSIGYCGGYLYTKYKGKADNIISDKNQGTVEITKKDNSNLSIFNNTYYNYNFEFPSDWIHNTTTSEYEDDPITSNQVTDMHTSNGEFVQGMTWNNDQEDLSLLEWYEKYDTTHTILDNPPTNTNAEIAGLNTIFLYRPTLQAPADITVIFDKDGTIFRLWYVANESGVDYEDFLHLLQTFEFNGQVTSDQIPEVTRESLK